MGILLLQKPKEIVPSSKDSAENCITYAYSTFTFVLMEMSQFNCNQFWHFSKKWRTYRLRRYVSLDGGAFKQIPSKHKKALALSLYSIKTIC